MKNLPQRIRLTRKKREADVLNAAECALHACLENVPFARVQSIRRADTALYCDLLVTLKLIDGQQNMTQQQIAILIEDSGEPLQIRTAATFEAEWIRDRKSTRLNSSH